MRWQSTTENPYFSIEGVPGTVFLPVVDAHIVVAADSSSVESPMSVMLPVSISGMIESEADQDVFELSNLVKGESLVVEVFVLKLPKTPRQRRSLPTRRSGAGWSGVWPPTTARIPVAARGSPAP